MDKGRTETKWHVEIANVYYSGASRITLIPPRGKISLWAVACGKETQEIHVMLAYHPTPFERVPLKTEER